MLIEAISALSTDTWIGTATTDRFLFAGTLADVDMTGPLAQAFTAARQRIIPNQPVFWEVKHVVPHVLVTKTRGLSLPRLLTGRTHTVLFSRRPVIGCLTVT
jgi:hypothetical protein